MPQMAPLNWFLLFIMFLITFLLINILNYFMLMYFPKSYSLKKSLIKLSWKW